MLLRSDRISADLAPLTMRVEALKEVNSHVHKNS